MIFAKQFHLNYSWFFGGCAKSISVGLSRRCICGLVLKNSLWNVAALVEEKLHLHPLHMLQTTTNENTFLAVNKRKWRTKTRKNITLL